MDRKQDGQSSNAIVILRVQYAGQDRPLIISSTVLLMFLFIFIHDYIFYHVCCDYVITTYFFKQKCNVSHQGWTSLSCLQSLTPSSLQFYPWFFSSNIGHAIGYLCSIWREQASGSVPSCTTCPIFNENYGIHTKVHLPLPIPILFEDCRIIVDHSCIEGLWKIIIK